MKKFSRDQLVRESETNPIRGIYAFESSPRIFKVGHSRNVGRRLLQHPKNRCEGFVLTDVWVEDGIFGHEEERKVHDLLREYIVGGFRSEYFECSIETVIKAVSLVLENKGRPAWLIAKLA